jgi:hypothetical protein
MSTYQSIARGTSFLGRYRIFLGEDHILLMEQFFFIQSFYRFYFRDIHGFIACQTPSFFVALAVFGFAVMMLLLGVLNSGHGKPISAGSWTWIVCGALLFLFSAFYMLRGKMLRVAIVTKVQQKRLKWTMTGRKWRSLRDRLVPLIEAQQKLPTTEENQPLSRGAAGAPMTTNYEQPDSPRTLQTSPGA